MNDPEEPVEDRLKLAYQQVCTSFEAITDFRGKLLALLPLATGTAGVLLIGHEDSEFLGPLGLFGAVVTTGLYMYEFRGIQRCHRLEDQAKTLERKLGLSPGEGQFQGQPRRLWNNMLGPPAAGLVVYLAVIFAWLYLAGIGFKGWKGHYWWLWVVVGVGVYVAILGVAWLFVRRHLEKWTASPDEDLVRRGYRAYAKGRIPVLKKGLASDVVWYLEGRNGPARYYESAKGVLEFLGETMKLANGTLRVKLHGVFEDKEYAISVHVVRWKPKGEEEFEDYHVLVFQIRGERIKKVWHYIPDEGAHDRFFSETAEIGRRAP